MPAGLIIALVLLAAIIVGIWLTFNFMAVLVTLAIAAIVGWVADLIVPGKLPYGWLGAMVAGLLGSWLGGLLFGPLGPEVADIHIVPAFIGAIILAFVVQFAIKRGAARRT
ncbi:MAG: GlsB/YeaQ/YmgE family stress response membrane protein [Polyangiaceae bacterium]|nr:GlsB/YeaQ/YmgE family stress response membrane protein [Polyangiaceae bacterium]